MCEGPTFIGIGAEKSATTWCWACLNDHPDICMAYPKELNYFNKNYKKGRAWYLRHFSDLSSLAKGEISPLYMDDPKVCIRISNDFPGVKIIVILRDPYERALSHLLMDAQFLYGAISKISIEKIKALSRIDGRHIRRSLYYEALKPYFEQFARRQVSIFFYDDIKKDAKLFIKRLYETVGVSSDFVSEYVAKKINKATDFRLIPFFITLRTFSRIAKKTPVARDIIEVVNSKTKLREKIFEFLRVNKGKPDFGFEEIFGKAAREKIALDLTLLKKELRIDIPPTW